MSKPANFQLARFTPQTGDDRAMIEVHFNPQSLQYTVSNTMSPGKDKKTKQYVSQSTGKLSMDLIFDTTDSGQDVRTYTEKIANFMVPKKSDHIPPIVLFEWGLYTFQGTADSYRETIDYFSSSGVPLRASINLSLSQQDEVFTPNDRNPLPSEPLNVPGSSMQDVTSLASQAGDPRAARGIAESNNLVSLRMSAGASLSVDASVKVAGAAGFSAGASLGMGASVTARAAFGASASAGVSASSGAFDGLRSSGPGASATRLNLNALAPRSQVASLSTDAGASFQVGGRANIESSSSLTSKVDGSSNASTSLRFDE
jgi:hypothetical protein